jgi:hypothetical protein
MANKSRSWDERIYPAWCDRVKLRGEDHRFEGGAKVSFCHAIDHDISSLGRV